MKKNLLSVFYLLLAVNGIAQTHSYLFNDSSLAAFPSGPTLIDVQSCGATAGTFATETITTSNGVCPGAEAANTFQFQDGGGLQYPNTSNLINQSYTIHLFFKFNSIGGYARIIDFSQRSSDKGIYLLGNCLNFYPNGNIGPACPFVENVFYLITFVRDAATNLIKVYVDGVLYATYNDDTNTYVPAANNTPINFFLDDEKVTCENQPGSIKYLSISGAPSTDNQVDSVWRNICDIALPVNWASFTLANLQNKMYLEWHLANGQNAMDYLVERSIDGTIFNSIATIQSSGNSVYRYTDFSTQAYDNTIFYYRIKQVDKDAKYSYSQILKSRTGTIKTAFNLINNPVNNIAKFNCISAKSDLLTVNLVNADGKVVMRYQTAVFAGQNTISLNMQPMAKGMYLAQAITSEQQISVKLIRQ